MALFSYTDYLIMCQWKTYFRLVVLGFFGKVITWYVEFYSVFYFVFLEEQFIILELGKKACLCYVSCISSLLIKILLHTCCKTVFYSVFLSFF